MDNTDELGTQQIEYTRTVVPPTMRSPFWKYFGFPSDSSNNVLTKQKIVCSLCNAVIAYNKNTSNLRTHIVARHPELLIEMYKNKKAQEASPVIASHNRSSTSEPPNKRPKTLYMLGSNETKGNIITQSSYVSTPNVAETSVLKPYNESIIEVNEGIEQPEDKTTDNIDYDDYPGSITNNTEYTFEEIEVNNIKITASMSNNPSVEEELLEMLITDLQPTSIVEEAGFMKFAMHMGTPATLLRKSHVEQEIKKMYNKHFKKVHKQLKAITNTIPYSLSMESYQNIENKTMMCIYFNHVIPSEARLEYTAYTTIEATPSTDYDGIFSDFNLSNCSAVMMSEEIESVEQFFESHGIPIIPCFETVINNCMLAIFANASINSAYRKMLELIEKQDDYGSMISIPEVFEENPWSKYNFLQFVQDHVTVSDEDNSEAIETCKQLVAFLNPLKVTLETIADEPLPLCSLMRPLGRKLIEEYFSTYYCESEVLCDVKNTVSIVLTQRILNNMFLTESSFLDPRFQNITVDSETLPEIKESIAQRFEHLLANDINEEKPIKTEVKTIKRKSSLKQFFNRGLDSATKPLQRSMKRSLDYEIMKYTAETGAELDQCPLKWWEENEFTFRKLQKISDYYMCVPCCATNHFKYSLNDRIALTNRRFMLRKSMTNQMWFLHFNKDILGKLNADEQLKK